MRKKIYIIYSFIAILCCIFVFSLNSVKNENVTTQTYKYTVYTHGNLNIKSDEILFKEHSSKDIGKSIDEMHLFNFDNIRPEDITMIKYLEANKATYLIASPNGLDVRVLIEDNMLEIPFYDIITKDDVKISLFAYGGEYDYLNKEYKALALAGNFDSKDFGNQLVQFIKEKKNE